MIDYKRLIEQACMTDEIEDLLHLEGRFANDDQPLWINQDNSNIFFASTTPTFN